MKLKDQTDEQGFVLLESLISLTILVGILMVTLPFVVDLLEFRYREKEKLELSRVAYDYSFIWDGDTSEQTWRSGEKTYSIAFNPMSIQVKEGDRDEKQLEILQVEFE